MNEEELLTEDVPETSEEMNEDIENVDTSNTEVDNEVQTGQAPERDIEAEIERKANELMQEKMEKRLIRDRINRERDEAPLKQKYQELESIMKAALNVETLDEAIQKSKDFYKQQGVVIPEVVRQSSLSERDETILARAEAGDIISLGKSEMEKEANRIAGISADKRSLREKVVFEELCSKLSRMRDEEQFKSKGYDTKVLENEDFVKFRNKYVYNTPVSEIYENYQKITGNAAKQPYSPGSASGNGNNNEIKEYYTPEEARKFTEEELDNPKLMKALEYSMRVWANKK